MNTENARDINETAVVIWHDAEKDPPKKAGRYLVASKIFGEDKYFLDTLDYYKAGDFVTYETNVHGETAEERLKSILFYNPTPVYAEEDGFVTFHEEEWGFHKVDCEFWAEPPQPPTSDSKWIYIGERD